MHRSTCAACGKIERLAHKAVAHPAFLVVLRLGQRYTLAHHRAECTRLRQSLSVELAYPLRGTVGRDDYEWYVSIESLGHCRCKIEHCRSGRDAHRHRFHACCQAHAYCAESGRALVGHRMTIYVRTFVEVVNYGRVAAARAYHCMAHSVSCEQRRENVHVFLVAVHFSRCLSHTSWCPSYIQSPPTRAVRRSRVAILRRHRGDSRRRRCSCSATKQTDVSRRQDATVR